MHGQEATQISKQYMWVHGGDRISDDDGYQLISRLTNAYFGVELGTREYRHITVAIGRMYLGNEAEMDDEEMDAIAAQAGHSAGIARSIYAVEAGRLPTMTSDKLRRFARASEKWAEVLGLVPGVPAMLPLERRLASRDNTYSTSTVGGNDQSVPAIGFDVNFLLAKLQATIVQEVQGIESRLQDHVRQAVAEGLVGMSSITHPTSHIGPQIEQELAPPPSRPSTLPVEAMHENNDLDDMYLISDNEEENMDPFNDYNSSDLSSLGPSPPPPPRVASRYEEDGNVFFPTLYIAQLGLPQTQRDPLPPNLTVLLTQEFMVNLLKQHFPNIPNPVFKSPEQERAVQLALSRQINFVAVLPTGGGKSLLFTLPPLIERPQNQAPLRTIVVVPSRALLTDHLNRAKSIGIPAVQWTSTSRPPAAENQIIFVALETATGHGFMSYWKGQESRVVRLVIDEAHLMLTQSSFRANFSKLCQLAQFPVQKIYLSASLPPRLMPHFLRHAALPSSTNIVRARADQPNISYNVVKYTSMETEKPLEVAILIAKFLESGYMEEDQLGMIFCTSKREVEWLHTNFTLCSSHSDQMLEERARNEGLWKTSTHRWIASTTVLMQGIDSPRVGAVIFVKIPFGAMNIYQGAGRGGRDGRTSWAILLHENNRKLTTKGRNFDGVDAEALQEAYKFAEMDQCRRIVLSELMDGSPRTCTDLQTNALCDFCNSDSSLVKKILPIVSDRTRAVYYARLHPSAQPAAPLDEYDLFNSGLDGDIDTSAFDRIPYLNSAPPSHHSQPLPVHRSQPTFFSTQPVAPPILPQSTLPSMAVLRDMAHHQDVRHRKQEKAKKLDKWIRRFCGNCYICWANTGTFEKRHEFTFKNCEGNKGYFNNVSGWAELKKAMVFEAPKFTYCYRCGLPQTRAHRPSSHPEVKAGSIFEPRVKGAQNFATANLLQVEADVRAGGSSCNSLSSGTINVVPTTVSRTIVIICKVPPHQSTEETEPHYTCRVFYPATGRYIGGVHIYVSGKAPSFERTGPPWCWDDGYDASDGYGIGLVPLLDGREEDFVLNNCCNVPYDSSEHIQQFSGHGSLSILFQEWLTIPGFIHGTATKSGVPGWDRGLDSKIGPTFPIQPAVLTLQPPALWYLSQ
ncbi:hypothetical protein D9613_006450 [Agrocybe pediades]|uniref:DNA 3'-5' helicase n=1 Tax=Agrocybe pediades TaxID=84607 RepID=A0A8H4QUW0_9AGAR|nr:hypothetical protein D9613_006450 [Agrocybe pediades]